MLCTLLDTSVIHPQDCIIVQLTYMLLSLSSQRQHQGIFELGGVRVFIQKCNNILLTFYLTCRQVMKYVFTKYLLYFFGKLKHFIIFKCTTKCICFSENMNTYSSAGNGKFRDVLSNVGNFHIWHILINWVWWCESINYAFFCILLNWKLFMHIEFLNSTNHAD